MEALLISAIGPLLGMILTSLASWGISILKSKINVEIAKSSLDEVDRVIGTVVSGLTQTLADPMREAAADGKLSDAEKKELKDRAVTATKSLLTQSVLEAAGRTVANLDEYINQKVEERVLAGKSGAGGQGSVVWDQGSADNWQPTAEH